MAYEIPADLIASIVADPEHFGFTPGITADAVRRAIADETAALEAEITAAIAAGGRFDMRAVLDVCLAHRWRWEKSDRRTS